MTTTDRDETRSRDGLASQAAITAEIQRIREEDTRSVVPRTQPRIDFAPYRSSILRHPTKDLHQADPETIELASPVFGHQDVSPLEADLTIQRNGEPIGERIRISGRVLDGDGRPVRRQLVEIWQANAAGRYVHKRDQHPAPIDPNFTGAGRALTDDNGAVVGVLFIGHDISELRCAQQRLLDSERLAAIEEELRDLAFDRLRAVARSPEDDAGIAAAAEERRLLQARRAIAKAIRALAPTETDD